MNDVTKDLLEALKAAQAYVCGPTAWTQEQEDALVEAMSKVIARAEAAMSSSDDTPPSAEERRLRRMLCRQRHGLSAYMDDGEATFGGDEFQRPTDYLRESLDSIEQAWIEAGLKQAAQAEPQPDASLIARDDVNRMARESGLMDWALHDRDEKILRFAHLVIADFLARLRARGQK